MNAMLDNPISLIIDRYCKQYSKYSEYLAPKVISKYVMHDDSALNERD